MTIVNGRNIKRRCTYTLCDHMPFVRVNERRSPGTVLTLSLSWNQKKYERRHRPSASRRGGTISSCGLIRVSVRNLPVLSWAYSLPWVGSGVKQQIANEVAVLLLDKLIRESTPVVAFYYRGDIRFKLRGVVCAVAAQGGLIVTAQATSRADGYLRLPIGNPVGSGCTFLYDDKRDLPEETRSELTEQIGEAVLAIHTLDMARLELYFSW
jgi:hypothetical protein